MRKDGQTDMIGKANSRFLTFLLVLKKFVFLLFAQISILRFNTVTPARSYYVTISQFLSQYR